MTRVSENSSTFALNHSINRAKSRMEDLQVKGSLLKSITKPSDNPISNVEALQLSSALNDNQQYIRNADQAALYLNVTERTLEDLTDILSKAKEIAISQSSDFYSPDVRENVSKEVIQLRNRALSIANKRVGQRYIFSGFKTLERPFTNEGKYTGDEGHINLEVSKDFFVPINLTGEEVFFFKKDAPAPLNDPIEDVFNKTPEMPSQNREPAEMQILEPKQGADFASVAMTTLEEKKDTNNIFTMLDNLIVALENNDPDLVKGQLESFDDATNRIITLRTRVGSIMSSVQSAKSTIESENVDNASRKSKLIDADVAELFSDLTKQQAILKTTYQSSKSTLNQTLLDFLR